MSLDTSKTEKLITTILSAIREADPTISEAILAFGSVGYYLGAGIAGVDVNEHHLNVEFLQKEYYSAPTVDVALMLQGLLITSWVDDYLKNPQLSKIAEKFNQEKSDETT